MKSPLTFIFAVFAAACAPTGYGWLTFWVLACLCTAMDDSDSEEDE